MVSSELQAAVKHFIKMPWECTRKLLTVMFPGEVLFESSAWTLREACCAAYEVMEDLEGQSQALQVPVPPA